MERFEVSPIKIKHLTFKLSKSGGMRVAVVVYLEYPATDLVIVTVMDVKKD